ncbi:hypothetical protein IU501_04335 [Nocardia otitidiscaviarum]|uniref:Uncharacterized protein n=1 Tax=Nocardia otitidiscaviarum TaxID=1823 RepID=A0A379JIJ4_9NOCA|nr:MULTISPECIES: hypothetical protein [Nocardia]MBF6132220.1 hypothetical protein [Nocardia otitidiscaviarum]MBF6236854.1 hypothetical protein [Nocardia otitidiscaviarum]SUD47823.1 Uncharacterised protein [Nocardia otitidiscaviarum]
MSSTTMPTTRARRLLAGATLACALTGAAFITGTGAASAAPDKDFGDSTGWDHIDPRGFHHSFDDPRSRAERDRARRDHLPTSFGEQAEASNSSGGTTTTWTQVGRDNGSGWVVCRPLARVC